MILSTAAINTEEKPLYEYMPVHPELMRIDKEGFLHLLLPFLRQEKDTEKKKAYLEFLLDLNEGEKRAISPLKEMLEFDYVVEFVSDFVDYLDSHEVKNEPDYDILSFFVDNDLKMASQTFKYNTYLDLLICKAVAEC